MMVKAHVKQNVITDRDIRSNKAISESSVRVINNSPSFVLHTHETIPLPEKNTIDNLKDPPTASDISRLISGDAKSDPEFHIDESQQKSIKTETNPAPLNLSESLEKHIPSEQPPQPFIAKIDVEPKKQVSNVKKGFGSVTDTLKTSLVSKILSKGSAIDPMTDSAIMPQQPGQQSDQEHTDIKSHVFNEQSESRQSDQSSSQLMAGSLPPQQEPACEDMTQRSDSVTNIKNNLDKIESNLMKMNEALKNSLISESSYKTEQSEETPLVTETPASQDASETESASLEDLVESKDTKPVSMHVIDDEKSGLIKNIESVTKDQLDINIESSKTESIPSDILPDLKDTDNVTAPETDPVKTPVESKSETVLSDLPKDSDVPDPSPQQENDKPITEEISAESRELNLLTDKETKFTDDMKALEKIYADGIITRDSFEEKKILIEKNIADLEDTILRTLEKEELEELRGRIDDEIRTVFLTGSFNTEHKKYADDLAALSKIYEVGLLPIVDYIQKKEELESKINKVDTIVSKINIVFDEYKQELTKQIAKNKHLLENRTKKKELESGDISEGSRELNNLSTAKKEPKGIIEKIKNALGLSGNGMRNITDPILVEIKQIRKTQKQKSALIKCAFLLKGLIEKKLAFKDEKTYNELIENISSTPIDESTKQSLINFFEKIICEYRDSMNEDELPALLDEAERLVVLVEKIKDKEPKIDSSSISTESAVQTQSESVTKKPTTSSQKKSGFIAKFNNFFGV